MRPATSKGRVRVTEHAFNVTEMSDTVGMHPDEFGLETGEHLRRLFSGETVR